MSECTQQDLAEGHSTSKFPRNVFTIIANYGNVKNIYSFFHNFKETCTNIANTHTHTKIISRHFTIKLKKINDGVNCDKHDLYKSTDGNLR